MHIFDSSITKYFVHVEFKLLMTGFNHVYDGVSCSQPLGTRK